MGLFPPLCWHRPPFSWQYALSILLSGSSGTFALITMGLRLTLREAGTLPECWQIRRFGEVWAIRWNIPLALILAVLLNAKMRGSNVFRGIYFMPTVISTSISGMIFAFIFATQNGIANELLLSMNLIKTPIKWLTSQDWVMVAVTILAVWGGLGNYMLYFTTGMNSVAEDVYESAKIDGANAVQTFFYITLPMLSPVLKVVLMLAITSAFKDYEAIMVLSQGGPGNRSMVMFLYIYNLIFGTANTTTQAQIGYGALLSVVAALVVGIITVIYLFVSRKLDDVV